MAGVMDTWKSMGKGARTSFIAVVVIVAALTIGAFWWLYSEAYEVLFADLEPRDAARVVKTLEEMKIPYRLANGGAHIKVPASSVHEVRLKIMGSEVPLVGSAGFEIFNDSDFGMTEFSQRINYQRALEGELTRTVVSLKEVKYARVHLVIPERGLFKQDDNSPSASVTLFLHPQDRLLPQQIVGIQRLVAAAVPKLRPSQVTVTDQNGLTLSRQLPDQQGVASVSSRLQQKQAVEEYLTTKANEVLLRNFGAHQAMVSVDAELDFNQVKRTRENVLPSSDQGKSGVLRRRETRMGGGATTKEGQNFTTEVEYRLGRDVEQIVETPGKVIRLSVGIMVPSGTSAELRESIRELVKMAVGFDDSRGDAVAIYAIDDSTKAFGGDSAGVTPAAANDQGPQQVAGGSSPRQSKESVAHGAILDKVKAALPIEQWLALLKLYLIPVAIALLSLVVLGVMILLRLGSKRKASGDMPPELSESDRQRILEDIQQWLNRADGAQEG